MKQKLLFILAVLIVTVTLQAQSKVWDLGNGAPGWEVSNGMANGANEVRDNLGLVAQTNSTSLFANIGTSNGSFTDGFTTVNRFRLNGPANSDSATGGGTFIPTQRYLYFNVTANCTVTVWHKSGSATISPIRTLWISNGTNTIASHVSAADAALILSGNNVDGAGTIYIYSTGNNFNLYKIEVNPASALGTTTTLGLEDKTSPVSTNVQAIGSRVYVSNVKTSTDVNIYSITGALVKSFKTNSDMDFSFKSGLYIATVKTAEGQKSVKLLMK